MQLDYPILLYVFLFMVAALYASVGHGGASGYLALMSLYGISLQTSRPIALVLNCLVSLIAFIQFKRHQFFNWRLFIPLALVSIPCAYVGGMIDLDPTLYKQLLGFVLLFTSIRLIISFNSTEEKTLTVAPNLFLIIAGASVGFISGLLGIGGGIFLSPLLIFTRWADAKSTAGISALFILVNSLAGLFALSQKGFVLNTSMSLMILLALLGGILGSYLGSKKLTPSLIKKLLGIALLIASLKLIFT